MIKTEQISLLVGKNVELVCFAQYTLYIHLEGDITLTVEGGLQHTHEGTQIEYQATAPITESCLMTILESSVVSASVSQNGDLHLLFSNSDRLAVLKKPEFESYQLKIGGEEFIA